MTETPVISSGFLVTPDDLAIDAVFLGGFCPNHGCPCWVPGPVCDEFMGPAGPNDARCPRCGWSEGAHR